MGSQADSVIVQGPSFPGLPVHVVVHTIEVIHLCLCTQSSIVSTCGVLASRTWEYLWLQTHQIACWMSFRKNRWGNLPNVPATCWLSWMCGRRQIQLAAASRTRPPRSKYFREKNRILRRPRHWGFGCRSFFRPLVHHHGPEQLSGEATSLLLQPQRVTI